MEPDKKSTTTALVILAGGSGRRFGGLKQLAQYQGESLLQRAINTCLLVSPDHTYVVLGANEHAICESIEFKSATILTNQNWALGISESIKLAEHSLRERYHALLFLAADQVAVGDSDIRQLLDTQREHPEKIICSRYGEDFGIPAIFPSAYFPGLQRLSGDAGGKSLIKANDRGAVLVDIPGASIDIDYKADLEAFATHRLEEDVVAGSGNRRVDFSDSGCG